LQPFHLFAEFAGQLAQFALAASCVLQVHLPARLLLLLPQLIQSTAKGFECLLLHRQGFVKGLALEFSLGRTHLLAGSVDVLAGLLDTRLNVRLGGLLAVLA
jgi:hypothetical protein